jgi:hypothetical protein
MDKSSLAKEIISSFPPVEMPSHHDLTFHKKDCWSCEYVAEYLEKNRGKAVDGNIIRYLHQEMSNLSAKSWLWILPHYLPFCLTPEAEHNKMETEFLIYNLGPDQKFVADTIERLSLLNESQINCLVHFLEYCYESPHWKQFAFSNHIPKSLNFLRSNFRNPDHIKDWKLKLRYKKLDTQFQHFTVLADGIVGQLTQDFECRPGRAWMAMKVWAANSDECIDMMQVIGRQIGFTIDGNTKIFETEPDQPPGKNPKGYDISFTPYDESSSSKIN